MRDTDEYEQLFAKLEETFGELGLERNPVDGAGGLQIGHTLKVLVPIAGTAGQMALMEIILAELGESMCFLQLYSTLVMECAQNIDVLLLAINDLNFICPIGTFGVYRQRGQLYHKYCLPIDDEADSESVLEDVLLAYHAISMVLSRWAPILSNLALGHIDLETATQQGLYG